jgi:GNAT superfamily N-acetyltransferase
MTNSGLSIKQLELADMDAAASVHRTAFDHALPWLTGLHTSDEDRWFYRERVFPQCQVHGAFEAGALKAVIAFRTGWIDQLYVLPEVQGRGVGNELLQVASARSIASNFGPFSAICQRDAFTRRVALRLSSKPTVPAMKRRSRTRATSGRARQFRRMGRAKRLSKNFSHPESGSLYDSAYDESHLQERSLPGANEPSAGSRRGLCCAR